MARRTLSLCPVTAVEVNVQEPAEHDISEAAVSSNSSFSRTSHSSLTHFTLLPSSYVRKRSSAAVSPYSINRLRYDLLYRQPSYVINQQKEKLQSKTDQEPKPRKDQSPQLQNKVSLSHDVTDRENARNYYKSWKEDLPIEMINVDDYDEHRPASDGQHQLIFDA